MAALTQRIVCTGERRILTLWHSVPLFDAKVTLWCGITATFASGPVLLRKRPDWPATCSVTGSREVWQRLDQHLHSHHLKLLSFPWPARSPGDLTPMDFGALWAISTIVYLCNPQTLSDLKDSIRRSGLKHPRAKAAAILLTVSALICNCRDGTQRENV
ncbi:hypothetical protein TNCV_3549151 [Trichonephila clavipes]|nr:hypothetical protein TNCV_3549151 [Trichonephila clavipes]